MNLELTPKERIFLVNQLRILEKLYPDEAEGYERWREAVEGGYSLHYDDGAPWIAEELSVDECREVLDILQMFSELHFSYRDLGDKSGIEPEDVRFHGFDGNNETSYLAYADYFMNKLDRYRELHGSGDGLNSHAPFLGAYRRMLEVWKEVRRKRPLPAALNKEGIRAICTAAIHPDNREAKDE